MIQFHAQDCRLQFIEPAVDAFDMRVTIAAVTIHTEHAQSLGQIVVVGDAKPAIAVGAQRFRRIEGVAADISPMPDGALAKEVADDLLATSNAPAPLEVAS